MSTATFIKNYDSFPDKMKEDLSIIAEYLLFYYRPKASSTSVNFAKPSDVSLSITEQEMIVKNAESDLVEGRILSQLEAKSIAKTWRKNKLDIFCS